MDTKKIISLFLKKWPIIIIIVFVLTGTSIFYLYSTKFVTPLYSAESTMMVNKTAKPSVDAAPYSLNDVLLTQKLVKSYIVILNSKANLLPVIEKLNLNITPAQLRSYIKISGVAETEVLKITVTHPDKYMARDIADTMAEVSSTTNVNIIEEISAQVIDKSDLPAGPISPNIRNYCMIGALMGFFSAVALIYLKDYFDSTYKTEEDIANSLELPILACLPKLFGRRVDDKIADAPFAYKESFKDLRTRFQFATLQTNIKTIGVSSPSPSEGKTSVAVNLAFTLAETKLKVLLIDTDLRKPKIYKALDLPISPGFTELLSGQVTLENVVRKINGYETLDIITSGEIPQNPAELLCSTQMKELINNLEYTYDYIIFDTPPINIVTDASILAKLMDGIVYVVSYGQTLIEAAKLAKKSLETVEANIIGCVFNNVDVKTNGNSGYYRDTRKNYEGYGYSSKHHNRRKNEAS